MTSGGTEDPLLEEVYQRKQKKKLEKNWRDKNIPKKEDTI